MKQHIENTPKKELASCVDIVSVNVNSDRPVNN